ncbi:hypothetical protein Tco_0874420 [Tanacetum coccineum]|uniref:Uncharacterized protein n=1 Tax=Tanacetum coccineum TaxID=301880 RepID=A0ABQ5BS78_9ASTR
MLLTDKIDLVNLEGNQVILDISKPLPLGGPQGQVTIQTHYFFNKDLEYLISGDKEIRNALSISKLKAAYYLDSGLKELVPSLWIKSEHDYDISATYGITHWWFLRVIVLRRADYNEYKISESDFKNLHPNDFEDLYLLHPQGKLNHLSGSDKVHLFNAPRAVIYRDRNDQKKMMRENKVHKFIDGTLTRILEKMDHMVKDYKIFKFNPGMEHRIWTEDDKRRSEKFIQLFERRLKIRRIFRNLESFVSGRIRDIDYRLISRT